MPARPAADSSALSLESVQLLPLVREALVGLEDEALAHRVSLELRFTEDALETLPTDPARLRPILTELFAEAVRTTTSGTITVALWVEGADRQRWTVDVSDKGFRITSLHPALGFESVDVDHARALAEGMGGSLVLLPRAPGQGRTLRLTLESGAAAADPAGLPTISGLRILLAEDHADMQMAVSRLLEEGGASVVSVGDGLEAVARGTTGSFDMVLMDLRMPGMSGLQAARALRREGFTPPIVALTADSAALHRAEALDAGCDGVLGKPFGVNDLIDTIERARQMARSGTEPPS